jgi:hypothetical protein
MGKRFRMDFLAPKTGGGRRGKYSDISPQTLNFFKYSPRVLPTSFIFICGNASILHLIIKRNYTNAFF